MNALANSLLEKIRTRQARAGVVGLGYVGLPLAVEFARAGFTTTGIDPPHPAGRTPSTPVPVASGTTMT